MILGALYFEPSGWERKAGIKVCALYPAAVVVSFRGKNVDVLYGGASYIMSGTQTMNTTCC